MIYVMSDIHGQYEAYLAMLDAIHFSDQDLMYVIGDVIDRGEHGIANLLDIMARKNVILIRGNHEQFMYDVITCKTDRAKRLNHWLYFLGGLPTWLALRALSTSQYESVLDYINKTPLELHITVNERDYHLVHGRPARDPQEKLWGRFEQYEINQYNTKEFVIIGHTPTIAYHSARPMRIYWPDGRLICIDCGCAYQKAPGRLGCLCLDNWEETYIDL